MNRFDADIAIVGGGPAGTSTALHLATAEGIAPERIVLFDKASHPREKPCAGAVSAWGITALAEIGIGIDVPSVPMRGLRIVLNGQVGATQQSLGVVIRRSEFDASLWRRAAALGVRAFDGEGIVALERIVGGFKVVTTKREVYTRLVAACDGAGSAVRKLASLREPERKGHLYVLETPPEACDDGPREGLCDFDLTPAEHGIEGYYWDFPTIIDGAHHVSRGIYHANFTPSRDVKSALARALAHRGIDIARVKLKPFSTRPFVAGTTLALPGIAFVGEAAGIDAATGEGIAQAILLGKIAAHHLAQATRLGSDALDGYEADVRRERVGRHLLQSAWLARAAYGKRGAGWRRFLLRSSYAREAGARWYEGTPLGARTKARLAIGLAGELARSLRA